jgi:Ca2+:H+ antiporter
MSGNIVLSLEIGSAYAIQVALLQIPIIVAFSALWRNYFPSKHLFTEFTVVFQDWDLYASFFGLFLLSNIYTEGKSNYFKGALLLLIYLLIIAAYLFAQ